jgi:MoaA/NifB/PqqE/SkfB family radical SAM enzyme
MDFHQPKDILLVYCPPGSIEFPPRETAFLATILERSGFKVSVIDMNLKLRHQARPKYKSFWLKINEHYWHDRSRLEHFWQDNHRAIERLIATVVKARIKILFMDLEFPKEFFACEIIRKIKKRLPGMKIIVGGYSCYSEEQRMALQELSGQGIDHFFQDTAAASFPAFLLQLTDSGKMSLAPGQVSGLQQINKKIVSKDQALFPTYREFNLNDYRGRCLSVSLGHGCTGKCNFCKRYIYSDQHHLYTAGQVINEIHHHCAAYGITDFYFDGAPVQADLQALEEICDAMIASPVKISWSAEAVAHPPLPCDLLVKLEKAGCHTLIFCCVSGSDTILSRIGAGFRVTEIEKIFEDTARAHIRIAIQLITGFSGEYKKEFLDTQEFATRNRPRNQPENKPQLIEAVKAISVLKIYPGTKLFLEKEQSHIHVSGPIAIDRWSCGDGNSFLVRKTLQNQLNYHLLGLHIFYNPHDLIIKIPPFNQLKIRDLPGEIMYQLYNTFDPWHAYHSDILSKKVISYVWEKTSVVDKSETDYPILHGIEDGRKAFAGPETVHLDITNHCNFNCIGCWDRSPLIRQKGVNDEYLKNFLSLELVKGFIDDLIELEGTRFIKFGGGGEPTMHPHFIDILTYLRSRDKYVEIDINTNFSLMRDALLDLIIELQVNLLTVSLWAASPEVYVQTHPNQKEVVFENIVANLKRITSDPGNRVLKLFIHNVLMNLNHHEVEAMLELALDVKADEVHFTLVDPVPGKTESLLLSHQERLNVLESLKKIKPFVNRYNEYHDPETNRSIKVTNFHEFFIKMSQPEVKEGIYDQRAVNQIPCYIGWLYTRIMADGRVVPCCKGHRLPMGNINKNRFVEIWNSPRYEKFRYNGKTLEKSAPYFSVMGNDGAGQSGCLNCDNIMHNTAMHDKFLCYSSLPRWFIFKMGQWKKKNTMTESPV